MAKLVVLALAVFLHKTVRARECCPGGAHLLEDRVLCPDNSSVNLTCEGAYLLSAAYNDLTEHTKVFKYHVIDYCTTVREDSTHFSLICLNVSQNASWRFRDGAFQIQGVLMCISVTLIIITMLVYFLVPSLLDLQGKCIMHVLAGIASFYTFIVIVNNNQVNNNEVCITFAYIIYVSAVYMLLWLTVLSFHIWRTTVKTYAWETVPWLMMYHVVGIGGTLTALVVLLLAHYHPSETWIDFRPGFGEGRCWFQSRRPEWIYLYGPMAVLFAINMTFYLWTMVTSWRTANNSRSKTVKYRFKLCIRLFVIMGITWCFELILFAINKDEVDSTWGRISIFILDIPSMCQGIMFFLVLVVFRKRVRRGLANRKICLIRCPDSWKHLEDEEMESAEEMANNTTIRYKESEGLPEAELLNC